MTVTQTQYGVFEVERHGEHVLEARISNPPMNVIDEAFGESLESLLADIAGDDSIRAVVFSSAIDGVFIAGADLSILGDIDDEKLARLQEFVSVFDRLAALPQPTVCAIGGMALGGGFEFTLACDFRFMADGFGEVGLPEVRLGLLPGGGGTQRLPRLVGAGKATEMLIKGMRYAPQQALELGLIHGVVPADELRDHALKYADSLAKQAPRALRHIKRLVRASYEMPAVDALELERSLFVDLVATDDAREGIAAFFEGRKAAFTGS